MNSLNITNETKRVSFIYETTLLKFEGTCTVSTEKEVSDISATITLLADGIGIGNCNSNGNISVSIWNDKYKSYIDTAASDFKELQAELTSHYSVATFNDEVL